MLDPSEPGHGEPLHLHLIAVAPGEYADRARGQGVIGDLRNRVVVDAERELRTRGTDVEAIRGATGKHRGGLRPWHQVHPPVVVATPGAYLTPVANLEHVVAATLVVAIQRPLGAEDQTVAAAVGPAALVKQPGHLDVGGGWVAGREDGHVLASQPRLQVVAERVPPGGSGYRVRPAWRAGAEALVEQRPRSRHARLGSHRRRDCRLRSYRRRFRGCRRQGGCRGRLRSYGRCGSGHSSQRR